MDFGCGVEASYVVSVDLMNAIRVGECLVSKDFLVVHNEVVELGVEFLDFFHACL